jgi:hypothetical protein
MEQLPNFSYLSSKHVSIYCVPFTGLFVFLRSSSSSVQYLFLVWHALVESYILSFDFLLAINMNHVTEMLDYVTDRT